VPSLEQKLLEDIQKLKLVIHQQNVQHLISSPQPGVATVFVSDPRRRLVVSRLLRKSRAGGVTQKARSPRPQALLNNGQ
jgi:hypothetical protein